MEQNQKGKKGKERPMRNSPPSWTTRSRNQMELFLHILPCWTQNPPGKAKFMLSVSINTYAHVDTNSYTHQRAPEELEQPRSPRERDKWARHSVWWGSTFPTSLWRHQRQTLCQAGCERGERWIIFLSLTQTPPCTKWCLLPLENKIPHLCQCRKVTEKMVAV